MSLQHSETHYVIAFWPVTLNPFKDTLDAFIGQCQKRDRSIDVCSLTVDQVCTASF